MTKMTHDGVTMFQPQEVSKAEGDMATFVIPHIIAAMLEAEEKQIPIETVVQGLCALAGSGLAQVYADDPRGGNYALARCLEVLQENYRVAMPQVEQPKPRGRPPVGAKVLITSDDWSINGCTATMIDPEPHKGSSRVLVGLEPTGTLLVLSAGEVEEIR